MTVPYKVGMTSTSWKRLEDYAKAFKDQAGRQAVVAPAGDYGEASAQGGNAPAAGSAAAAAAVPAQPVTPGPFLERIMQRYGCEAKDLADPAVLLNLLNNTRRIKIQPEASTTGLADGKVPWNEAEQAILGGMDFTMRVQAFCNGGRYNDRQDLDSQEILLQVPSGPVLSHGADFTAAFKAIGAKPFNVIYEALVAADKAEEVSGGGAEDGSAEAKCMLQAQKYFAAQLQDESIQKRYKALIRERVFLVLAMANTNAKPGEKITVTTAGLGVGLFIKGFDSLENDISVAKSLHGEAISEVLAEWCGKLPNIEHVIYDPYRGVKQEGTKMIGTGDAAIAYSICASGEPGSNKKTPIIPTAQLALTGGAKGRARRNRVARICSPAANGDLVSPPFTGNEYADNWTNPSASNDPAIIGSTDAVARVTGQRGAYDRVNRANGTKGNGSFYPLNKDGGPLPRGGWRQVMLEGGFGLVIESVLVADVKTGECQSCPLPSAPQGLCLLEVDEVQARQKFEDAARPAAQGGGARAGAGRGGHGRAALGGRRGLGDGSAGGGGGDAPGDDNGAGAASAPAKVDEACKCVIS